MKSIIILYNSLFAVYFGNFRTLSVTKRIQKYKNKMLNLLFINYICELRLEMMPNLKQKKNSIKLSEIALAIFCTLIDCLHVF